MDYKNASGSFVFSYWPGEEGGPEPVVDVISSDNNEILETIPLPEGASEEDAWDEARIWCDSQV